MSAYVSGFCACETSQDVLICISSSGNHYSMTGTYRYAGNGKLSDNNCAVGSSVRTYSLLDIIILHYAPIHNAALGHTYHYFIICISTYGSVVRVATIP